MSPVAVLPLRPHLPQDTRLGSSFYQVTPAKPQLPCTPALGEAVCCVSWAASLPHVWCFSTVIIPRPVLCAKPFV